VALWSRVCGLLGRWHKGRQLLEALPLRLLARAWLRSATFREELSRPDDLTVLIGVRNRADYRLENALRSIRSQQELEAAVRITVVDYGSAPSSARHTEQLCERYRAGYVRVEGAPFWSRSRCLNVGIRRTTTKYLLLSDADVIFSPTYLSRTIRVLRRSPASVVCAPMLDLPEESADAFGRYAETGEDLDLEGWRARCSPRLDWTVHPSIAAAHTTWFKLVRGYDEFYRLWGFEDADLMGRLGKLGLEPHALVEAFYLHQWHPKFEGLESQGLEGQILQNHLHFEHHCSILRNDHRWGRG